MEDATDLRVALEEFRRLLGPRKCANVEDDEYWLRFIRAKNMDLERAVEVYMKYDERMHRNAILFSRMMPSEVKHVYERGIVSKLPGSDLEGRAVFLFRFGNWNTKEVSMDDVYLACVLLLEEMSYYSEFQRNGVVMLHDYDGFGFNHFRQMTFRNFMRILQIMQGSFPLKFKAFHEVNQPSLFYVLYKIFYPIVPHKLRKRIFMHGNDQESLLQHFPKSTLPTKYGGDGEDFCDRQFMEMLISRNDYYADLRSPFT